MSAVLSAFAGAGLWAMFSKSDATGSFCLSNRYAQLVLRQAVLSGAEGKAGRKDALASQAGAPRAMREANRKTGRVGHFGSKVSVGTSYLFGKGGRGGELNAGLLGILKDAGAAGAVSNVFGPGGLGTGINNAMGGLRGSEMGGAGGLGTRGVGPGGGGLSMNSVGLGALGTVGMARTVGRTSPLATSHSRTVVVSTGTLDITEQPAQEAGAARPEHSLHQVPIERAPVDLRDAEAFLRERAEIDGLFFQTPAGYWANTYVPGDQAERKLRAEMDTERAAIRELLARDVEALTRRYAQPLDPPLDSSMALYLNADHTEVTRPTRALLQVGLQGALQLGRRRPPLTLALLVDVRSRVPASSRAAIRAALAAFADAKERDDRFTLYDARHPSRPAVAPEQFEYGRVAAALEQMFAEQSDATLEEPLSRAIARTSKQMIDPHERDDERAPLGASGTILFLPAPLRSDLGDTESAARDSAVAGVPVSAIGVGDGADPGELEAIALEGQGARRTIRSPDDARACVDRQLAMSSRAVARALRLRIRLAPNVKLVRVIGSHALDEVQSESVRVAERAIDRRLAKDFGIESDRGDDEDGIQIVIPAFYAQDQHVILLDVVVEGPGPVAEVTLRYKDLVRLKNGVARARLTIARGTAPPSPLETSVLKSFLAHRISARLRAAGGDLPTARATLEALGSLVRSLRSAVPGWQEDAELLADESMLGGYDRSLARAVGYHQRILLGRALAYASLLKIGSPAAARGWD